MLISLNWIRDFVDLPVDLDPHDLAERFTVTTAEVEEVRPVRVDAKGLIAARVLSATEVPGASNLRLVELDAGNGRRIKTVSAAPVLHIGTNVIYAPPGASVRTIPDIGTAEVGGHASEGMVLPGEALGIPLAVQEAIFLNDSVAPGQSLESNLFDDWLVELDNKSITHRPDLWGHYGIAREMAAIFKRLLKPYPVVPLENIVSTGGKRSVAINIADPSACRRYCGLVLEGLPTIPAPLWMQLRLGCVGMRPISGLVDLTNYIMADLGQPMHAFDAEKVSQIEVDWAKKGQRFRTLDGMERELTEATLMIQCQGENIAIAGVMGGLETEVTETTTSLFLESANFDPAAIRRTASRLGLRTDASARFEKSLDPAHAPLAVQRFLHLAGETYADMKVTTPLCDGYPAPATPIRVSINPNHVGRTVGRDVSIEEAAGILSPLEFEIQAHNNAWTVNVPSFRATNDISIEADVIEEIVRYVGYNNVEPTMPRTAIRSFEPNAQHELETHTLKHFTGPLGYHEVHGYIWYEGAWLTQLGYDPGRCVELKNPAASGCHRLRKTLLPNLLAALAKNRHHFSALSLMEVGSVFHPSDPDDHEYGHAALISAKRDKKAGGVLLDELKGAVEAWAWTQWGRSVSFLMVDALPSRPWEHPGNCASIMVGDCVAGRISVLPRKLRLSMDEHLVAWSAAWAELYLSAMAELPRSTEAPGRLPEYPVVELDFSIVVPAATRYADLAGHLQRFEHPLLKRMHFLTSYEGKAVGEGLRSLTFKTVIGDDSRTLVDDDSLAFRQRFEKFVVDLGLEIRK